jgi:hypothetical protein
LRSNASFPLALPTHTPAGYDVLATAYMQGLATVDYRTPGGGTEDLREFAPGASLPSTPVTRTIMLSGDEWDIRGDNYALSRELPSGVVVEIVPSLGNDPSEKTAAFMAVMARAVEDGLSR